mgnify:CR=1 FL=1
MTVKVIGLIIGILISYFFLKPQNLRFCCHACLFRKA